MSVSQITKCDVPGCRNSFVIQFGQSYERTSFDDKWIIVASKNICPEHSAPLIKMLKEITE